MSPAPITAELRLLAPDLAGRLGAILGALVALIARRFHRDPRLIPLIIPLWTRITRAARRFERAMARLAAGQPARPSQPTPPVRLAKSGPDRPRPAPLPTGRGWLIHVLGYEAAAYASQLEHLLAQPGVAELLAASPAATRILRPLARMLGCNLGLPAHPPKTAPPARPPRAKPRAAAPPRDVTRPALLTKWSWLPQVYEKFA